VLHQHADALRAEGVFAQIEVGLLNGAPSIAEALARITAPTIRVVPFFMEAGYFTNIAIPKAVGDDKRVRFCPPIGVHPAIADIAAGLAAPNDAIVLVGHGSASAPGRPLSLHAHAARLARAEAACLEEPPFLADVLANLRAHPVSVIGFFAGAGMHVRDDVPGAIAAENAARGPDGHKVRFHGTVTQHPAMTQIIQDQAASGG
jgi:sirohydrochlorin ferrochelatase